jgi:hypothetical protein
MAKSAGPKVGEFPARAQAQLETLLSTLGYAESEKYHGYNKHDGLNSPFLHALALQNRWLRLLFIQLVMRSPFNLRPLFSVRKTINPKGMSLFCRTYLILHELAACSSDSITQCQYFPLSEVLRRSESEAQGAKTEGSTSWLEKARHCLDWLVKHSAHSRGYTGHCWGYPYDWQDVGFFAPAGMPNCVVTCFASRAFLHAYELTGESSYLEVARSACSFLLNDLSVLHDSPEMLCISYAPVDMKWIVMDTSALAAALLAKVSQHVETSALKCEARRLMNYVVDKQTDYGAWYYSHPPKDSRITHDNYHTGFILDAILDYADATGDQTFLPNYHRGLNFYKEHLFLPNGAPKWMHDKVYPHDIHGSAQGIITFSQAVRFGHEYRELAEKIAQWTLANFYNPREGYFYYQTGRLWTKKFTLMRWCNAWMAWAIASLLRSNILIHD